MRVPVVLLRQVKNLGSVGAVCSVKRGYLGFLLREKMAMRATKENLAYCERERARLEASNQELYDQALAMKVKLDEAFLPFIRSAGETGHLYGSIGVRDVIKVLEERGLKDLKASMVGLPKSVKTTGVHDCTVQLHPDVILNLHLVVAKTADEATALEHAFKNPPTPEASAPTTLASDAKSQDDMDAPDGVSGDVFEDDVDDFMDGDMDDDALDRLDSEDDLDDSPLAEELS